MALRIKFSPLARSNIKDIFDWIAQDNPDAASRVVSRIRQTAMMFGAFPKLGRTGRVEGTREFKVTGLPYLIVYRIESDEELDIVTIIHERRDYPLYRD